MADKNTLSVKIKGQDAGLLSLLAKERAEFKRLGDTDALNLRKELNKLARANKLLSGTAKKGKPIWGRFAQGIAIGNIAANAATAIFSGMARAIKGAFGGVLQAGIDSEKVWTQTAATLERHGISVRGNIQDVKDFADEMQTATGVSDEEFAKSINNLIDRGLSLSDAMDIVSVSVDIAASKNKNATKVVNEFADAVGKKDLLALEKYGIVIDNTKDFTTQLADATGVLETSFGGAASAASESASVLKDVLGQSFGDLQEQIFFKFQPIITEAFKLLIDIVKEFTRVLTGVDLPTDDAEEFDIKIKEVAVSIGELREDVESMVGVTVAGFKIAANATLLLSNAVKLATGDLTTERVTIFMRMLDDFDDLKLAFKDFQDSTKKSGDQATATASQMTNDMTGHAAAVKSAMDARTNAIVTNLGVEAGELKNTSDNTLIVAQETEDGLIDILDIGQQARIELRVEAAENQWASEEEARVAREEAEADSAARRLQIEEQFAADAGDIVGSTMSGLISSFDSVNKSAEEVWKDMAKDFTNLFLQKILISLLPGGAFVTSFLSSFKFWDVAANDRALIREGDRAAGFITKGITDGLDGFAPNVQASSVVNAVLGVGPNRIEPVSQSSFQSSAPIQIIVTDSGISTSDRFTNPRGLVSSVITRLARSKETLIESRTKKRFTDPNPFATDLL